MKQIKTLLFFSLYLSLNILPGCKKDSNKPIDPDKNAPGPIKSPQVENMAGAAKISYVLPKDQNLLYVRAEYEINGASYEIKPCSFFRVPVNTNHCLIAKGNEPLTFVYFGVALNE